MKTSTPTIPGFPAIARRNFLQGLSVGAGGLVFAPLLNSLAAQAAGTYTLPKRVIFVLFDNGFHEDTCTPVDLSLQGEATRELPLGPLKLPPGIEAFTPFKDRLAIVHGLRAGAVLPDHGAGFGALSAVNCGSGDTKHRNPAGESIDAAVAKQLKGIFPLLNLGIDHGQPATKSILVSSAWSPGRPIATQCRPELAYESLFGSIVAASALMTGLTNVVTITSGLCAVRGNYTGFSNMGTHAAGHNNKDVQLNLDGLEIVNRVQRFTAERTAALLTKLQTMPEGSGTMLDNTLLVYTSDSANRQHTHGENWPFVLLGNLGGRLKTNRFVAYPMRETKNGDGSYLVGTGAATNPAINALYNTILHAIGAPRPHFNLVGVAKDDPAQRGPLKELLA